MAERWVRVDERYEVSDLGRVKRDGLVVTVRARSNGYPAIAIRSRGTVRLHTLVLEAFVGPRPRGKVCRHLDDDKTNNTLDNLCWGSSSQNGLDYVGNGRHWQTAKDTCPDGHALDGVSRAAGRQPFRFCRTCHNARMRERRRVRRA